MLPSYTTKRLLGSHVQGCTELKVKIWFTISVSLCGVANGHRVYREYTESILSSDTWSALWDCGCWHAVVLVLPWLPLHKDDILYYVVCRAATTHDVIAEGPRPKPSLQHCIMAV